MSTIPLQHEWIEGDLLTQILTWGDTIKQVPPRRQTSPPHLASLMGLSVAGKRGDAPRGDKSESIANRAYGGVTSWGLISWEGKQKNGVSKHQTGLGTQSLPWSSRRGNCSRQTIAYQTKCCAYQHALGLCMVPIFSSTITSIWVALDGLCGNCMLKWALAGQMN